MADSENIMIKKTEVADPEIGLKIGISTLLIKKKIWGIDFKLTIEHGKGIYESNMHINRILLVEEKDEHISNHEYDIIFPFVDPQYVLGQTFIYHLHASFYNEKNEIFHEETLEGKYTSSRKSKYLDYWINEDSLQYKYANKTFHRPPEGTLTIFDPVVGKPGLGVRISWGKDLDVWKVRLITDFEEGKAAVITTLNPSRKYKLKFLPLTIFAPYPRSISYKENFNYSFRVELYDEHDKKIDFEYHTDIPWKPNQMLNV